MMCNFKYIYLMFTVIHAVHCCDSKNSTRRVSRQAQDNGCILPEHPLNGQWRVYNSSSHFSPGMLVTLGAVLQVKCDDTYKLDGDAAIVCIGGEWTSLIGQCLKKCPSIYSTPIMSVSCTYNGRKRENCTDAVDGTVAQFQCASYYEDLALETHPSHVCFNGKWSYTEPECVPVCGQKSTKNDPTLIVNGTNAPKGDYPWQVALYDVSDNLLLCGGSLLNQRVILTAAHCISDEKGKLFPKDMYVVAVGKYYREYSDPRDTHAQFSEIHELFKPREYKGIVQNYLGDIAIIVTKRTFVLSPRVQPVCVDWAFKYDKILLHPTRLTKGYVSGWGFTVEYKNPSEVLKDLELPLVTYEECLDQLLKNDEDYEKFMTDDKLCAGYINSGTSVCKGDSGGGLVFKFGKRYYIKAVVSLSPEARTTHAGCDSQQYTLFTHISRYINEFILAKEAQYKPKPYEIVDCDRDVNCNNIILRRPVTTTTTIRPIIPPILRGNCLLPEHPKFGHWTVFGGGEFLPGEAVAAGTILRVECTQRYQLNGNELILCVNSTWSSPIGQCLVSCPSVTSTETVSVTCTFKNEELKNCNNPPHGSIAKFRCAPFYESLELVKNPVRLCLDGSWDSRTPECVATCGKRAVSPQLLIISGTTAQKNDYPWHVGIYKRSDKSFQCGGTLINQRLILTAAHCLSNFEGKIKDPNDFVVAVGKLYRKYDDPRDQTAQFASVEDIAVPLEFKGSLTYMYGDIGILVAKKPFRFSAAVLPACVDWAFKFNNSFESKGQLPGWGFISESNNLAEVLNELTVPLISPQQCRQQLPENFVSYLTSDKFCAGYINKSSAICAGDSGGGLVVKYDGRYFIRGVASAAPSTVGKDGRVCDIQQYALYTDVSQYNSFILQKDAQFKRSKNADCAGDDDCKKTSDPKLTTPKPTVLTNSCILPPHPKFGSWALYLNASSEPAPGTPVDSGALLQITCLSSHALDGDSVVLCEKGSWSSAIGQCLRICPQRSNTTSTKVRCFYKGKQTENCMRPVHNTQAKFDCVPYYEDAQVSKNPVQVCVNGTWDQRKPECVPVCGLKAVTPQTLIINGNVAQNGSYPWQVAIYHGNGKKFVCSGSLISPRAIITSAQCVTNYRGELRPKEQYTVAAGKYYREYGDTRESEHAQFQTLSHIFLADNFRGSDQFYLGDIAVLISSKPFELSEAVQPVCMDWTSNYEKELLEPSKIISTGYVVGWGYTTETGSPSDEMRDLKVPIVSPSECRPQLPDNFRQYLTSDKFCAGYLNKGTGICKGDSGAGLVVKFGGRYYLSGIVSLVTFSQTNRASCSSQNYALYTKMSNYLNFIHQKYTRYV